MRYRLLASYQGAPFEAGVGPEETGVVLFAACPPPEDLGFEPATGHWRKQVDRADVQTLYESRPVGTFRGERCVVLDDLTDRLHIAYLGHDAYRAEQLGYWEVDRGVFELITPRQEVTEIVEQRLPVAAPGASASPAPDHGSEQANGSRPHTPSPDVLSGPERLTPGHQALDDYLQDFPQYAGSAAAAAAADAPAPAADEAPLPLEAEAMRAARKAMKDQHARPAAQSPGPAPEPGRHAGPRPASPPVPSAPAGLSEPSSVLPSGADSAMSVPSWSPQSRVPAQPASHAEKTDIRDHAPEPAVPLRIAPQAAVPQHVAPQPGAAQPSAPQAGTMPPNAASAAPPPAPVDGAVRGVPLSAPTVAAAGGTPPLHGQSPAVNLQRGAGGPAPSDPGSSSISNSPAGGGDAAAAARGPAAASSQVNGTYHGRQATAGGSPPGQGLPRDQFGHPFSGPAVAGPVPATSAYAGNATVAGPATGTGTGQAHVGVAVADPVLTVPYPPAAPEAPPAVSPAATPAEPAEPGAQPASRRRRASRRRLPTHRIFSELAAQAGIPASAYAVNEDVDGAMCLVRTSEGFEVFNSLAGARHEVRVFQDEESAYFYLFGVLAADAVRTGALGPVQ